MTHIESIPQFILDAAIAVFVSGCERFPGLRLTRNQNFPVVSKLVPMREVLDRTCDGAVEILDIPVLVEYSNLEFDMDRLAPSVPGIVRVDSNGKSWLDADFGELGKQRFTYDKETEAT